MVLADTGGLINREEYTPYGETSFGSFARKRYRVFRTTRWPEELDDLERATAGARSVEPNLAW